MHDFSSDNVTEDPIKIHITLEDRHDRESAGSQSHENFVTLKIPGQLNAVIPLTPVQIFVKEEPFVQTGPLVFPKWELEDSSIKEETLVRDQLDEVVPLSPVQIFIKEEESVYCNTEEPELVPLVPVLPKEEHVENSSEEWSNPSDPLALEQSVENSSEEWSNQSDPLALDKSVANESYVEYVETTEPILMELGAPSTEDSSNSLRITQESTSTVENGEAYDPMGNHKAVPVFENGKASSNSGECVEIMDTSRVPLKVFRCGFRAEGEVEMPDLSHAARGGTEVWHDVSQAELRPKRTSTLKAQHRCGDCGESFERLEHLMRHRLGHIRAALRKPLSTLIPAAVPEPQVSTIPDSRRTAVPVSARTSPKRSPQQAATTPQPKRWVRRKKARRRRVS